MGGKNSVINKGLGDISSGLTKATDIVKTTVEAPLKLDKNVLQEIGRGFEGKWDITGAKGKAALAEKEKTAQAEAQAKIEADRIALLKKEATEQKFGAGTDVILGKQAADIRGSSSIRSVSSGMGLSKGRTGLQT